MAGRGRPKGSKNKPKSASAPAEHAGAIDTRTSNVGERKKEIRAGLAALYQLDRDIADIIEEQVKPLREDKSRIKDGLRERFGLTSKVIQARYYSFRIEQDALRSHDEVMLDTIRELFEVCPVTGQGSFASALESTVPVHANGEASEPEQGSAGETHDPEQAWSEGEQAGKRGLRLEDCPYALPHQTKLRGRWEEGWETGSAEVARAMGSSAARA